MVKTTGQICRELNTKPYKIDYLIRNGLVPVPQKLASGQRIFSDENIQAIKRKLIEMSTTGKRKNGKRVFEEQGVKKISGSWEAEAYRGGSEKTKGAFPVPAKL